MKNTLIIFPLVIILIIASCGDQKKHTDKISSVVAPSVSKVSDEVSKDEIIFKGDEVLIPEFTANLNLDPELFNVLKKNKESVIADYYFYGNVDADTKLPIDVQRKMDLYGLRLAKGILEINDITMRKVTFHFSHIKIPRRLYDHLADKIIRLNINFYSGRKVFKNNILDVDAFDSAFSDILNNNNTVTYTAKLLKQETIGK